MSDLGASQREEEAQPATGITKDRGDFGPTVAAVSGALIASLVLAATLAPSSRDGVGNAGSIAVVSRAEIDQARTTMDPVTSAAAVEDAKTCKAPLAYVTLASAAPDTTSTIRIRSGSYLSPPFTVTASAQRVAVPFPTPYLTGAGVLTVEGQATQLLVSLSPMKRFENLSGVGTINVWWTPKNPC